MNERIVISEDLAVIYAPDGSVLLEVVEAVDEGDVGSPYKNGESVR